MKSNQISNKNNLLAWGIFVMLFIFYSYLFFTDRFDIKAYIFMLCFNTFFLFGLLGFPRLVEFDIRNFKLILAEIKEKKEEIFATEKQLKKMAVYIADVLAFISLLGNRLGSRESHKLRRDWVKVKLQELKKNIGIELKNVAVYEELFGEIDELTKEASLTTNPKYKESKARIEELVCMSKEQMEKDIKNAKN